MCSLGQRGALGDPGVLQSGAGPEASQLAMRFGPRRLLSEVVWSCLNADYLDQSFDALKVVRVGCVQRELVTDSSRRNPQVRGSLARLPASRADRGADLAVGPGCALIVRKRVERRLYVLQHGYPPSAFYRVVSRVRAEGQLA